MAEWYCGTRGGIADTTELRAYVTARVPELTKNVQHPTVDRDNLIVKFGFPVQ